MTFVPPELQQETLEVREGKEIEDPKTGEGVILDGDGNEIRRTPLPSWELEKEWRGNGKMPGPEAAKLLRVLTTYYKTSRQAKTKEDRERLLKKFEEFYEEAHAKAWEGKEVWGKDRWLIKRIRKAAIHAAGAPEPKVGRYGQMKLLVTEGQ